MLATADFETTTDVDDCRVWAFGVCEIGNPQNFIYGNNIDDFMRICSESNENHELYFHNLKFDGEFIFYWLYRNGFELVKDRRDFKDKSFCTLISDKGQFYQIEICFKKKGHKINKVTIRDSLKILNFSVSKIAKDFQLPISKLKIDYKEKREIGHELTKDEIKYLKNDVEIMSRALDIMFKNGMDKMTIGADSLSEYKKLVGMSFDKYFPTPSLEVDTFLRASYKGGFTYLNKKYKNKIVNGGIVLDVNSLYPSRMYSCPLPYGEGVYFEGKYENDTLYNLYVQRFKCQFKLKKRHIPTVQIKGNLAFIPTEYLENSGDEEIVLTMTNIDLELFLEHYNIYNMEYIDGYKFKSSTELFKKYIDKWVKTKIESDKTGNMAMRSIAKLMLNSLYGKFAVSPVAKSKYPVYDKKQDLIKYVVGDDESRDLIYIPVGTFITAHARYLTITSAQKVYDRFIYADTDSLHLEGYEVPKDLEIDKYKLGAWKNELIFTKGKYLRQKCYMEKGFEPDEVGKIFDYTYIYADKLQQPPNKKKNPIFTKVTCAGMPSSCYDKVDFENFKIGQRYGGKLQHCRVKGGVVLKDIDFTIKR